jgi:hypothetical protein
MARRTYCIAPILLCVFLLGCASKPREDISENPALRPYLEELKEKTDPMELSRIREMSKSELILLLHGYGTWIRNQWFHGNRDPKLLRFFHDKGIDDPEAMSMIIIEALWSDLNRNLSPQQRNSIEAKRALVARKRANYEKLESECAAQLAKAKSEFALCYQKYGLPSKNPVNHDPFFHLVVEKTGRVREIEFFEGASSDLKHCLEEKVRGFSFSPFADEAQVTLYILEFPSCRVAERDTLHQ